VIEAILALSWQKPRPLIAPTLAKTAAKRMRRGNFFRRVPGQISLNVKPFLLHLAAPHRRTELVLE